MKAICPNCQAAYRVADEKIPDTGAQIKCPKCENTFIVKRPAATTAATSASMAVPIPKSVPPATAKSSPAPVQAASKQNLFGELSSGPGSTSTDVSQLQAATSQAPSSAGTANSKTPNLDALSGEAFVSVASKSEMEAADAMLAKRSKSKGMSAIRAQSKVSDLLEGYRVRTARGLTYDFPSEQAMMRWLDDREDLKGYQAAEPGGDWVPVSKLLGFSPGQESAPVISSPMAPRVASTDKLKTKDPSKPIEVERLKPVVPVLPGAPVPGEADAKDSYSTLTAPKAGLVLWAAILIAFTLFLALGAISLTRYGLVDLSSVLPMEKIVVVLPGPKDASDEVNLDEIKVDLSKIDKEAVFSKALSAGRRALASKKFSRAALEFNRARAVHPGSARALDGLARAFMGLGDVDRARQVMKQAKEIEGK